MLIDAHVHTSGRENTDDVLRTFDGAGVDLAVLLAPFLTPPYSLADPASLVRGNEHLARLVKGHEDRLVGFAVLDPRAPDAVPQLRRAVEDLGLRGLKCVPSGWHVYDDAPMRLFEEAGRLRIPVLLHSGIFIDGRSSRFCRPADYESLRDVKGLKATLAHLGWPWTDEAIAVGLIDRINDVPADCGTFRFDTSFGAPPPYRHDVLKKALSILTPDRLQWGSDCFLPCESAAVLGRLKEARDAFEPFHLNAADRDRIFAGTARAWLDRGPEHVPRTAEAA